MTSSNQRAELQSKIWRIANDVRGSVDVSEYRLEDSVLVNDFPTIWEKLKQKYQSELSALAYRPIPKGEDVAEVFADLLKRIL